jgi:serine phosphatase RsbU (regulator of sigma subunit)
VTVPRLGRLLDRAAVGQLLATAVDRNAALRLAVVDTTGRVVATTAAESNGPTDTEHELARRTLVVDGVEIGNVVAWTPNETTDPAAANAEGIVALVAGGLELAAAESLVRRDLAATALDDLRELSLLARLSDTIGASLEAAEIARILLAEIVRALRPNAGLILPPGTNCKMPSAWTARLAAIGTPDALDELALAGADLVERLAIAPEPGLEARGEGRFGSILAAPMQTPRGNQGVVVLGRAQGDHEFTARELKHLSALAGQSAVALERAAFHESVASRERFEHELAIGKRIQRSLMPRRFPHLDGWEIAAAYEAAREVGGDFYDVFPLRDRPDEIGLVVADVTGKGIPAAILMADARALVHAAADYASDPALTLAAVNRILLEERATSLFVTIFHGRIRRSTGLLRYASAGHDPMAVLRADGGLQWLDAPGRMAGMNLDLGAESREVVIEAGDSIVLWTDGVTEARNVERGFFGEERLAALLRAQAGRPAAEIVEAVTGSVRDFRGEAEASDDVTLLVVRRLPTA